MLPFSLRKGKVKIMSPQENNLLILGQIVKQIPKKLIEKRFRKGYLAQIRDCVPPGRSGEIAVFDKAYVDFAHLNHLNKRGVFWVTRSKKNLRFEVMGQQLSEEEIQQANYMRERKIFMGQQPIVLSDCRIKLVLEHTSGKYPAELRKVDAFAQN